MEVEPGLPHRHHARVAGQLGGAGPVGLAHPGALVGMDADGGREGAGPAPGQLHRVAEVALPAPQADGHHPHHPGGAGPGHDALEVALEVLEVEVGVRVDQPHYFTRVPGAMASPTVTSCRSGASPAASSIPCEVMPRSGRGARLATTTMRFPTSTDGSG